MKHHSPRAHQKRRPASARKRIEKRVNNQLPPEAFDNVPRAQLTFTDEAVHLSRFDLQGQVVSTYPVALAHVARAFVGVPAASGLLPPRTLFWESRSNRVRIGIHLPPQPRTLSFSLKRKPDAFHFPALGFVFVGAAKAYSIFAVADEHLHASSALYRAPLPNVNPSGLICAGNVEFPFCAPDTIERAAKLFFDSYFNHDLAHAKLQRQKTELDLVPFLRALSDRRAKTFPREVLVPCGTLGALINSEENFDAAADAAEQTLFDGPDWDDGINEGAEDFGWGEAAVNEDEEMEDE